MFKDCPYAKFVCSDCQKDFEYSTSAELLCLKEQLANLAQVVSVLANRMDDGFQKVSEQFRQSPQIATDALVQGYTDKYEAHQDQGTNFSSQGFQRMQIPQAECIVGSCNDVDDTIKAVPEKKYIYASKFSNNTLPAALSKFLCGKLVVSEDDIDCRLLVSANKDVSLLNYVSFKIGVDPNLFKKLMQPDIWPSGVLVREFFYRPKNFKPIVLD